MTDNLTIWTYDWVPDGPRGFVRDLRLRWACEEAGLDYAVRTVAFDDRETNHLEQQPFGQIPFLTNGDITIFESGAGLLHLAERSEVLMPRDAKGKAETMQWVIAALNSIEMVTMPWVVLKWYGQDASPITDWMDKRLGQIEAVLAQREWLAAGRFTVAHLLMADALRVADLRAHGERPAAEDYVARVTARPAFEKAHANQIAHFEAADEARKQAEA